MARRSAAVIASGPIRAPAGERRRPPAVRVATLRRPPRRRPAAKPLPPTCRRCPTTCRRRCSRWASRPAIRCPTRSILWTRLVDEPLTDGGGHARPQRSPVELGGGGRRATSTTSWPSGATAAEPALAHSVHVDAGGLEPDTEYWYRFTVGDPTQPRGPHPHRAGRRRRRRPAAVRVRILPEQPGRATGTALRAPGRRGPRPGRSSWATTSTRTITGHRRAVRRHDAPSPSTWPATASATPQYKSDPAPAGRPRPLPLGRARWDDHEVDNNYAGLNEELTQDGGSGSDPEAFRAATGGRLPGLLRAPCRCGSTPPDGGDARIYRDLAWGVAGPVLRARHPPVPQRSGRAARPLRHRPRPAPTVADPAARCSGDEQEALARRRRSAASDATLERAGPAGGHDQARR